MDKTYKKHGKFFKYLTKMLWRARVLLAKTTLPKYSILWTFGISGILVEFKHLLDIVGNYSIFIGRNLNY